MQRLRLLLKPGGQGQQNDGARENVRINSHKRLFWLDFYTRRFKQGLPTLSIRFLTSKTVLAAPLFLLQETFVRVDLTSDT